MSLRARSRIDIYNTAGAFTWNKYLGAKMVIVRLIGGGASGQGQVSVATTATNTQNSGGGGAGGYSEFIFSAAMLGLTENVIVGAGGAALAASAVTNAVVVPGNPGGNSSFGGWIVARGGLGNLNSGRSWLANTNSGTTGNTYNPNSGNSSSTVNNPSLFMGSGGGASQSQTATVLTGVGVGSDGNPISITTPTVGGNLAPGIFTPLAGGIGGTRPGNATRNGTNGNSFGVNSIIGGTGGGAGVSTQDGVAGGNGGNGGFPGGGGGGAGFGVGAASGASGAGAAGIVIVETIF
jgi:hypothetical protein